MKCLFVINPISGTKAFQRKLDKFIGQLILKTSVHTIDTFFTHKKNDAYHKCASLKENEYDFIVSVGGDGTVNEVMSGLIKSSSHIPLALLAAGTVNDFATYLKLPNTPDAFVAMINNFTIKEIDVGQISNDCFANVVAGGMFSDIGFQVTKEEKNTFGPLAYYSAAISKLPTQLSISLSLKITADNYYFEEDASLFLITNSSNVGGFKDITPQASIEDGLLDLFIIKKCNVAELLNLLKDYKLNVHTKNPMIHYIQAHSIHIECDQDIIYDIDGEQGKGFPIDVKCLPHAIQLIIPGD